MPDEKQEEFILCPCCGKTSLRKPVEVKGTTMDHYMACIMTGVPFSHTYDVYAGKMKVCATMLSHEDSMALHKCRTMLDTCATKTAGEIEDVITQLKGMLELYSQIESISIKHDKNTKTFTPAEHVKSVVKSLLEHHVDISTGKATKEDIINIVKDAYAVCNNPDLVSTVPVLILSSVRTAHDTLYGLLVEAGFDENFWKGIELG